MNQKFWLLAVALLFFSGCIGSSSTISSAVPPGFSIDKVCGAGLWGDWVTYSLIGGLIGFFLVALVYMIGEILQKPEFVVGAKDDFYQTAVSFIIVANAVWMASFLCSELSPQLLGLRVGVGDVSGLYGVSFSYLNWLNEKIISGYVHVLMVYWRTALATSFYQGNSPGGIGSNAMPFSGLGSLLSGLSMLLNALTIAWITNLVQIEVLKFVMLTSLTVWLPLGVVCRCFKPTRRFGGALMALGLGLFFFYPIEISVNAAVAKDYTASLSNNVMAIGSCRDGNDCCSRVPGACQLTPPSSSYGRASSAPCSVDADCYSRECAGAKPVKACDTSSDCSTPPYTGICIGGTGGGKFLGHCSSGTCAGRGWCKPCQIGGKLEPNALGVYIPGECCMNQIIRIDSKGDPDPAGRDRGCKACSLGGEACRLDEDCCAFKSGRTPGICTGVASCVSNADCASNNCENNVCTGVCSEQLACSFDAGVGASSAKSILSNAGAFAANGFLTNALFLMFTNLLTVPFKSGVFGIGWLLGFAAIIGGTIWGLGELINLTIALFVTAFILPTINLILIINLVKDLSKFLGEEMDVSNLTRMI